MKIKFILKENKWPCESYAWIDPHGEIYLVDKGGYKHHRDWADQYCESRDVDWGRAGCPLEHLLTEGWIRAVDPLVYETYHAITRETGEAIAEILVDFAGIRTRYNTPKKREVGFETPLEIYSGSRERYKGKTVGDFLTNWGAINTVGRFSKKYKDRTFAPVGSGSMADLYGGGKR